MDIRCFLENIAISIFRLFSRKKYRNAYFRTKKKRKGLKNETTDLDRYMDQIFSAKQKELFLKKLNKGALTKTEKEYFSRVVKKKVSALADTELHTLSKKLLN
ncbi:MAG: hypothetical protein PHD29_09040 [bacterium]|nr:hypothetical protein [bacterium]MDD5756287.1 hypothetical protein [bacterium]